MLRGGRKLVFTKIKLGVFGNMEEFLVSEMADAVYVGGEFVGIHADTYAFDGELFKRDMEKYVKYMHIGEVPDNVFCAICTYTLDPLLIENPKVVCVVYRKDAPSHDFFVRSCKRNLFKIFKPEKMLDEFMDKCINDTALIHQYHAH